MSSDERVLDPQRPTPARRLLRRVALGVATGALEAAVQYTRERRQFGKPISSFQGLQFMLADMATQVEAARALVYATARYIDTGAKGISKMSAMSNPNPTSQRSRNFTSAWASILNEISCTPLSHCASRAKQSTRAFTMTSRER